MTVTPQGISVQTAYRWFRDGKLIVNRQYQRKLVWTVSEKERLIDSILKGYPLPLFLLAERAVDGGDSIYEIIDGMQRLNAIFGFIENGFLVANRCFDLKEFSRARIYAEQGLFSPLPEEIDRLDQNSCSNILDYQLAMTIFPGEEATRISNVFGRVNSGGKQLSDQERRQAGVISPFAGVVRELAAEIRGDVSRDELTLVEMPEISIETSKNAHGYKLKAEDIFWCYQGILRTNHLRDSEDEQVIADLVASILLEQPVEASGDYLDRLYNPDDSVYAEVNTKLVAFPQGLLIDQVKKVFSLLRNTIEVSSQERFHFRQTVYKKPTSNAQKQAFFAVFMAFYDLVMKQGQLPASPEKIMGLLTDLSERIQVGQKHVKTEDRLNNIRVVKGIIGDMFAKADVAQLTHGPGMLFDFENSIRRSRTETARYEFKQGLLRLGPNARIVDAQHLQSMLETICAIANSAPKTDGFLYIGIADKSSDADRVATLDGVQALKFEHVQIVGIKREADVLKLPLDRYVKLFEDAISNSALSEPLLTQLRTSLDVIDFKGFSILRIRVPGQNAVSFLGDLCYFRSGSSTVEAKGPQIAALTKSFGN